MVFDKDCVWDNDNQGNLPWKAVKLSDVVIDFNMYLFINTSKLLTDRF